MVCDGCKENAAALGELRRDLGMVHEKLTRLLAHLAVPPAPVRDDGVLEILRNASLGILPTKPNP